MLESRAPCGMLDGHRPQHHSDKWNLPDLLPQPAVPAVHQVEEGEEGLAQEVRLVEVEAEAAEEVALWRESVCERA